MHSSAAGILTPGGASGDVLYSGVSSEYVVFSIQIPVFSKTKYFLEPQSQPERNGWNSPVPTISVKDFKQAILEQPDVFRMLFGVPVLGVLESGVLCFRPKRLTSPGTLPSEAHKKRRGRPRTGLSNLLRQRGEPAAPDGRAATTPGAPQRRAATTAMGVGLHGEKQSGIQRQTEG